MRIASSLVDCTFISDKPYELQNHHCTKKLNSPSPFTVCLSGGSINVVKFSLGFSCVPLLNRSVWLLRKLAYDPTLTYLINTSHMYKFWFTYLFADVFEHLLNARHRCWPGEWGCKWDRQGPCWNKTRSAGSMLSSDAVTNDGWVTAFDSGVREGPSNIRKPDIGISGEECSKKRGPEKVSVAEAKWAGEELDEMKWELGRNLATM